MKILLVILLSFIGVAGCGQNTSNKKDTLHGPATAESSPSDMLALTVYKTPTCGCCQLWIDHLDNTGFITQSINQRDLTALKQSFGIDSDIRSCHTAVHEQGFVFEGHVPAKWIKQFLASPPKGAIGLSVPKMPLGSPGMEVGDKFNPYDIIQVMRDGQHQVYAHIASYEEQF